MEEKEANTKKKKSTSATQPLGKAGKLPPSAVLRDLDIFISGQSEKPNDVTQTNMVLDAVLMVLDDRLITNLDDTIDLALFEGHYGLEPENLEAICGSKMLLNMLRDLQKVHLRDRISLAIKQGTN